MGKKLTIYDPKLFYVKLHFVRPGINRIPDTFPRPIKDIQKIQMNDDWKKLLDPEKLRKYTSKNFGFTSDTSRFLYRFSSHFGSWFDQMTYRPFKGAHRGYWYRLPWNKNKF